MHEQQQNQFELSIVDLRHSRSVVSEKLQSNPQAVVPLRTIDAVDLSHGLNRQQTRGGSAGKARVALLSNAGLLKALRRVCLSYRCSRLGS